MASDELVAELVTEVKANRKAVEGWSRDLNESDRLRRRLLVIGVVIAVLFGLTSAGSIVASVLNWRLNATAVDCIEVGGECYERSQAQTGQVVESIDANDRANAAAVEVCSRRLDGPDSSSLDTDDLVEVVNCAIGLLDQLEE